MDNAECLPKELDKETLKWLRTYGYTLNSSDKHYGKIKKYIKLNYPYEYYFYVDSDIKTRAEKEIEYTGLYGIGTPNGYKGWSSNFRKIKKNLIKELYGLEKKGIR